MTRQRCSGMTLVEVLVAMFILGVSSSMLFQLLTSGGLIRGRGYQVAAATRLAQNEAQIVRRIAASKAWLSDTSYDEVSDALALQVKRTVLRSEDVDPLAGNLVTETVRIEVFPKDREKPLATFMLLQGYR
jgi:prepilin-type N-terminal cleavage/methylation domain-containing protein